MISPFGQAMPGLRIKEGAPPLSKPTKEEIEAFPSEARTLLDNTWRAQEPLIANGQYDLRWMEGRHLLIAGGTGPGLGGAFATALLGVGKAASVTVLGRDLSRSLNYETGKAMQAQAEARGVSEQFHWLNDGMALEGGPLEKLLSALKAVGAAGAKGAAGILLQILFGQVEAGRVGAVATIFPLCRIATDFVQAAAPVGKDTSFDADAVGLQHSGETHGHFAHDKAGDLQLFFSKLAQLPLKQPFLVNVFDKDGRHPRLQREGVRRLDVPELALKGLDFVGKALTEGYDNPFPRTDAHDAHLDEWMFEVVARLNNDENSDFYYKHWVTS